jgi:hypothetical protein
MAKRMEDGREFVKASDRSQFFSFQFSVFSFQNDGRRGGSDCSFTGQALALFVRD